MIQGILKKVLTVLVVAAGLFVITIVYVLSFYPHQASETRDCAVVFGAAVWPGSYGPIPSHALADRTLAAVDVYKRGLVQCIIASGADSIYGAHEVDVMTDILLEEGILSEDIILDRQGIDTRTTIEHLDKRLSYILISNDFHLARIGLLAQRAGLAERGFSLHAAPYVSGLTSGGSVESARYSREPYFVFRETIAFWYYFFITLFK
jgi:vancomycin permeability regulator SanA